MTALFGTILFAVGLATLLTLAAARILAAYRVDDPQPDTGAETWTPNLLATLHRPTPPTGPRHAATTRLSAQQRLARDIATGRQFARLYEALGRSADTALMPTITDAPGEK